MGKNRFENILGGRGGRFLFVHCPDLKVSIASVWFRAGSIFDPVGKEGLAHFFEHLLLQKTRKEPSRTEHLHQLESKGIDFYAYTEKEAAYYYHIQEPERTKESLGLLALGIVDFIFDDADIEKEKGVILSEKSAYDGNREDKVWDLVFDGLYHKSAFAHNLFGTADSLNTIHREDIERFYHTYYQPCEAVWVILSPQVSGETEKEYLEETLRPYLDKRESDEPLKHNAEMIGEIMSKQTAHSSADESLLLAEAYRIPDISDEKSAMHIDLLRSVLASGWISWLNDALRTKRGIIYWARSAFSQFRDRGYVVFFLDTQSASKEEVHTVFDSLVEDLKQSEKINESLDAHKNAFATRFLRVYHNPEDLLWWYGHSALYGLVQESPEAYLKNLKKLTGDELSRTARKVFTKENQCMIEIP